MLNVRLPDGTDWQRSRSLADMRSQVESELGDEGRVLIRASGTEPVLRVMVEARNGEAGRRCAERLVAAVLA